MKTCPHCGKPYRQGMLFCENCGRSLTDKSEATLPTRQLDTQEYAAKATWGTARFSTQSVVVIQIRDADQPIRLQPTGRVVIGRVDTTSVQKPDIDLTPYGALEKGVSRIHAAIDRSEDTLTLIDMGSSNGTHLNGQRLLPDQPRVLRDGDEIRFGKLVAHVYFK